MSKAMALNQIERQIEALPPVDQLIMVERVVRQLKRLLSAQPMTVLPQTECKGMTEKLNQVYKNDIPHIEPQLCNAQFVSIGRDE
jgi:hypothetical protein